MRLFSERRVGEDEHSAHDGDERDFLPLPGSDAEHENAFSSRLLPLRWRSRSPI